MSAHATLLQTEAMSLLQAGFGARFKTYRNTPMLQVQPTDLPMLGVYILRERFTPSGDANHAEPHFQTELTLGISGGVDVETGKQNEIGELENMVSEEALQILFTNPKFVILTEGIAAIDRQGQFAKVGETTLWEIRLEMTIPYKSWYPPNVPDMFDLLHIETRYPSIDTDPAEVIQIIREYDLTQNEVMAALARARQSKAGLNSGRRPHQP